MRIRRTKESQLARGRREAKVRRPRAHSDTGDRPCMTFDSGEVQVQVVSVADPLWMTT